LLQIQNYELPTQLQAHCQGLFSPPAGASLQLVPFTQPSAIKQGYPLGHNIQVNALMMLYVMNLDKDLVIMSKLMLLLVL